MGLARTIAKTGHASRAKAERVVTSGRVKVDGRVVTDPAFCVGPESQIELDGQPLAPVAYRFFAFHKPTKVVCSPSDPGAHRLITDFFPSEIPGLTAAGRLDANTSGLVLVSNDAAWNGCAAGGNWLEKEYQVEVSGEITRVEVGIMTAGVHLPTLGFIRPESVKVEQVLADRTRVRLVVIEAKNRQVRRLFHSLRHDVLLLRRTRIGPVRLGNLPAGRMRPLTREEIAAIRGAGQIRPDQPGR